MIKERGRIGIIKDKVPWAMCLTEKDKEKNRINCRASYHKHKKPSFFPNYACVDCGKEIKDNENGRKFKCVGCKFKKRVTEKIKNIEDLKALSRNFTNIVLGHLRKDLICSECKQNKKIEFHHKIYPLTEKEIIKAYKKKLIVAVCRKCHRNIYKCINTNIQNLK